ncbi:major facilitator superfamily domain-containing protein [Melanogaster broomeanus]|nr:major facilitator superfamily domain-containing protein [Melanogaster broomeanus]
MEFELEVLEDLKNEFATREAERERRTQFGINRSWEKLSGDVDGMFVGGSFVPCIPQVARDLHSTAAVTVFTSLGVSSLVWSAYSSFYGRRPMYLLGNAFDDHRLSGAQVLLSVGAAVIGDIYKLEERGTAMGSFFGAVLVGLAIAPLAGGIAAEYWSWRAFNIGLGIWGLLQMLLIYVFLPETAHPNTRGIDKMEGSRKMLVWVNPFSSLRLLRSPNIVAVTLANTFALISDYVLLIPLAYTVGVRYGIAREALIGVCFLPSGLGNLVGALIGGRLSDMLVRRWKEKREGVWVPEDRLRAAFLGNLLVPLSVTLAGLATTYIDGPIGLTINLVCLFTNGIGVDAVITPIGAYNIDIVHSRSAEVMAASIALRSLLVAVVSALVMPSIETIGVAATNGISAVLALLGCFLIWLTIRYGDRMRAYVDVDTNCGPTAS